MKKLKRLIMSLEGRLTYHRSPVIAVPLGKPVVVPAKRLSFPPGQSRDYIPRRANAFVRSRYPVFYDKEEYAVQYYRMQTKNE